MNDPTCSRFPTPMPGEGDPALDECAICHRWYNSELEPEISYYDSPVCARCADDPENRCAICHALLAESERAEHAWDAHQIGGDGAD